MRSFSVLVIEAIKENCSLLEQDLISISDFYKTLKEQIYVMECEELEGLEEKYEDLKEKYLELKKEYTALKRKLKYKEYDEYDYLKEKYEKLKKEYAELKKDTKDYIKTTHKTEKSRRKKQGNTKTKVFREEYKKFISGEYESLSVADFCKIQGIALSTFYNYKKLLLKERVRKS